MSDEVRRRWRNWSGEQRCRPVAISRPRTREGLIEAILLARESEVGRGRVKVAGSGHSFTPAALTDGTLIEIDNLDRVLAVDRSSGLVKVEAGIQLGRLNRALDRHGLALENLGDIDRQTLAGAISTATHGTGSRFQNLSAQIEELELIDADGRMHVLSQRGDADAFRAARVGLGALGAIYSVTLRTVTNFRIDRTDRARPLAELLPVMDEFADSLDHFEFYVFPYSDTALCRESMRTYESARPRSAAAVFTQEVIVENWMAAAAIQIARAVPSAIPSLSRLAARGAGKSRKLDQSFRVYASQRRVKFTEMELAVPREAGREAVRRVVEIAERPEHRVYFPIEVRFVRADDAFLSPSYDRDSTYIAVHHDTKANWRPYFEAVAAALAEFGARPHWGKRHELGASELAQLYPRFSDFARARAKLDPEGAFANAYTDRVLGPVEKSKRKR